MEYSARYRILILQTEAALEGGTCRVSSLHLTPKLKYSPTFAAMAHVLNDCTNLTIELLLFHTEFPQYNTTHFRSLHYHQRPSRPEWLVFHRAGLTIEPRKATLLIRHHVTILLVIGVEYKSPFRMDLCCWELRWKGRRV